MVGPIAKSRTAPAGPTGDIVLGAATLLLIVSAELVRNLRYRKRC